MDFCAPEDPGREGGRRRKFLIHFPTLEILQIIPRRSNRLLPPFPIWSALSSGRKGGGKRALFVLSEIWMARSSVSCTYVVVRGTMSTCSMSGMHRERPSLARWSKKGRRRKRRRKRFLLWQWPFQFQARLARRKKEGGGNVCDLFLCLWPPPRPASDYT